MKKFLALTLALLMALSLVACGSQPAADDNQDADNLSLIHISEPTRPY